MGVRSADEAWTSARFDPAMIEAIAEADIEGFMIAEGENPDAPLDGNHVMTPDRIASPTLRPKRSPQAEIVAPTKSA